MRGREEGAAVPGMAEAEPREDKDRDAGKTQNIRVPKQAQGGGAQQQPVSLFITLSCNELV